MKAIDKLVEIVGEDTLKDEARAAKAIAAQRKFKEGLERCQQVDDRILKRRMTL